MKINTPPLLGLLATAALLTTPSHAQQPRQASASGQASVTVDNGSIWYDQNGAPSFDINHLIQACADGTVGPQSAPLCPQRPDPRDLSGGPPTMTITY